ncbi:UTP--glucose-1-phosphate uridylyltransferase [Candidatus Dependentiae bacterium]|nr:MAG: UTP--glucose-1-phosphate uridylyltransferase [Candidatus Dependentiae bacterium]
MIAIIPSAGLGTRFLPFTKSVPKELVPIMGVPSIQYIIKEACSNDITSFCIVINKQKTALKQYLTIDNALNTELKKKNKLFLVEEINNIIEKCTIQFIDQYAPLGLGHAVLCARELSKYNEPFVCIMLPDELLFDDQHEPTLLKEMHELAQQHTASVIAVKEVPLSQTASYGIIKANSLPNTKNCFLVNQVIEKPNPLQAPSRLAIIGRYVLEKDIFDVLPTVSAGSGGEIQLTDGIAALIDKGKKVIAYQYAGNRFDVGSPQGWLDANIFINNKQKKS